MCDIPKRLGHIGEFEVGKHLKEVGEFKSHTEAIKDVYWMIFENDW